MKPNQEYTIFIPISAFNDRYIKQTLTSAIEQAEYPQRVSFGVWEHRSDQSFSDLSNFKNTKHVKVTFDAILGVGPTRLNALTLYDYEDFIFQIDAHMLFAPNWDSLLIQNYFDIMQYTNNSKIIISTAGPWWSINPDTSLYYSSHQNRLIELTYQVGMQFKEVSSEVFEENKKNPQYVKFLHCYTKQPDNTYWALKRHHEIQERKFDNFEEMKQWFGIKLNDAGGYPKQEGRDAQDWNAPFTEHHLISAHYFFIKGSMIQELLPDPLIIFGGEEPTLALRASTRGFQIFTILPIIVWHFNKHRLTDMDDRLMFSSKDNTLRNHSNNKSRYAIQRSQDILQGNIVGYWGAPDIASLEEYEKKIQFNFKDFYKSLE